MALLAVWIALGTFLTGLAVVFSRSGEKELVVTLLPYTLALSCTLAAATLWTLRKRVAAEPGVSGRRMQAAIAIFLNGVTFAVLLVWLHGLFRGLLGVGLEVTFLMLVYWLYTRVLVPE